MSGIEGLAQEQEKNNPPKPLKLFGEDSLPKELEEFLSTLPDDKRSIIIGELRQISLQESFRGPLPPPIILKGYNDIIDRGSERIVAMAEKQSDHRMKLEDHVIREQVRQSSRGQIFGFSLGILGLCLSTYLGINGHDVLAGTFATTTIIGLVSVFVLGKRTQGKNLAEKNKDEEEG